VTAGKPILWEELRAPEIRALQEKGSMVILVGGATEQHGPHLPTCTDTLIGYELAKRVSALTGVPVLPPIAYGDSQTHKHLGATVWIRPETLHRLVYEICRCLYEQGIRRFLLIPSHGTNVWPFHTAWSNLRFDCPDIQVKVIDESVYQFMSPEDRKAIEEANRLDPYAYHAGTTETSEVLASRPDLVKMEEAVDEPMLMPHGALFDYRVDQISKSGVCGRATKASRELGERLFTARANAIAEWIKRALREEIPFK
jgi:creatinine amidohydrolase